MTVEPYFYILVKDRAEAEVEQFLRRKFEQIILKVNRIAKDDLSLPNHLVGLQRTYLQLVFRNVGDLLRVRKFIFPIVRRNAELKADTSTMYQECANQNAFAYFSLRNVGMQHHRCARAKCRTTLSTFASTTSPITSVLPSIRVLFKRECLLSLRP